MSINIDELNNEIIIDGLYWVARWRINNGKDDSFVVPFPTTYPVNIVYHGERKFKYGQYGIHLGQQDVLTFLGSAKKRILAKFIDCRIGSPTFKHKQEFYITPSSAKTLVIPPGVAHTFHNLEYVYTLNSYKILLPTLEQICCGEVHWTPESDIINIPEDIELDDITGYLPMSEEASDLVYHQIGKFQFENLNMHRYQHAETRKFTLDNGEVINVRVREENHERSKSVLPESKIEGVVFQELPSIKTGAESCIVPLTRQSPLYLVEHGEENYDFDSYGLHLGQEDHLVFLGNSTQKITLKLVDMREGSNSQFMEEEITFFPSPYIELIIPCGVAHALSNMAKIITVNRPVLYLDEQFQYLPGNDVIDWPINDVNYMSYKVNTIEANSEYYAHIVTQQLEAIKTPPTHNTPKSVVIYDESIGKHVKVILKEKVEGRA